MDGASRLLSTLFLAFAAALAQAQVPQKVVDIPTRAGVTQRMVVLAPKEPKAAAILFAGGHGGLQIAPDGSFGWGQGNFVVRTRELFAAEGLLVAVVDAPSDRQGEPYLSGYRQQPEHAEDIRAAIAWIRAQARVPVWLVGTSRGTQSAAYLATELTGPEGPDGVVLTSSILVDRRSRALPEMPLEKIRIPVLVVHHEHDGCRACPYAEIPRLMDQLGTAPRRQLLSFTGGKSEGDPCEGRAHHGYNGIEREVVAKIALWMLAK